MIKKVKNSLTIKIFLLITALLIAVSGITCAGISGFLPAYYSSQLERDLDVVSQEMAETIGTYENLEDAFSAIELFEAGAQVSVVILDEQGETVWPLEGTAVAEESVEVFDEVIQQYELSYTVADDIGENSAVKHYDLHVGETDYTMLVSGGMQPVNQAVEILRRISPYILAISAGIAVLLALAASFYLTAPIVRLSRTSERMAALDFEDRYQGKRKDEIGVLGWNLNRLSSNLSRTLEELRQANTKLKSDIELEREQERKWLEFFSAVSHELKTPITILEGHLQGMLQGVGEYRDRDYYLKRSLQTSEKMESMVQELLTISRMENNTFTIEETDVAELMRRQLAEMTELMEQKGLQLLVDMPEHLMAQINRQTMEKVFGNLLMNAVRYTPEDEENEIRVVMKAAIGGRTFYCSVENTGVFLPEEEIPHLFEAFYRVEQSRNRRTGGSGLGLYIVRMALERHGAQYGIRNTRDGVEFLFLL